MWNHWGNQSTHVGMTSKVTAGYQWATSSNYPSVSLSPFELIGSVICLLNTWLVGDEQGSWILYSDMAFQLCPLQQAETLLAELKERNVLIWLSVFFFSHSWWIVSLQFHQLLFLSWIYVTEDRQGRTRCVRFLICECESDSDRVKQG